MEAMIFIEETEPVNPNLGSGKAFWVKKGVEFRSLKTPVSAKKFTNDNGLKYTTFTSAMSRYKADIKLAMKKVPLTKAFWVQKGIEFSQYKDTAKKFADENDLYYTTMTSAFSRYKDDIKTAIDVAELKKQSPKTMTKGQRALVMINDFRAGLRKRASIGNVKAKSKEWFEDTLKSGIRGHKVSKPEAGKIYAFVYDAKYKDTLPYWDMYPLIIYLGEGTSKAGNKLMYGLNLHYIPAKARQAFIEELLKRYASTDSFVNKTKLKVDWTKVKGMQGSDVMIKSYLPSHVKNVFVEVKPKDWINIIFMPLQQFMSKGKKFSASKVWAKY